MSERLRHGCAAASRGCGTSAWPWVFHGWELAACEAVGDERTGDQASAQ